MKVRCNKEQKFVVVNTEELAPLTEELSYSRLEVLLKCPFRYKLKYIEKQRTEVSSIALDLGLICHKIMELKCEGVEYNKLMYYLENGYNQDERPLIGVNKIIDIYGFEFYEPNPKTGDTYEDKLKKFSEKVKTEVFDKDWEIIGTEVEFKILFNDKAVILGFIDRIDRHKETGDIRVVDYKTNSKVYEKKDLATPLQMYIYGLACKEMYGKIPIEYMYDMLFLGEKQLACTKGYMERGFKKLNNTIDTLIWYMEIGKESMPPKPTPLCHWCDYCKTNPNADEVYGDLCEYHSLWTRDNKTFKSNKEWIAPNDETGWE